MPATILDSDYMEMDIGIAYRFLDSKSTVHEKSILTEMHNHNYYEYFIITAGEIEHVVNGVTSRLKTGSLVFIRPDDCHNYRIPQNECCKMINVSFRTLHFEKVRNYFESEILNSMLQAPQPPTISLTASQISALKKKHYLLNVSLNKEELITLLKTLLIDVFSYLIHEYERQNKTPSENWLHSVLAQMNTPENIEEGLPALLRYSGFSHGHLCRIMKNEMGTTPSKYINDIRLKYAANLLATTDFDILSISVRLGFSSLSHFITIFKRKYGLSPSKYRAAHSNMHIWK